MRTKSIVDVWTVGSVVTSVMLVVAFPWIDHVLAATRALPSKFVEVDPGIFRSAQPVDADWSALAQRGLKTVVVLRTSVPESDLRAAKRYGFAIVHVAMDGMRTPSIDEVDQAIAPLLDPSRRPVLVHCAHGQERTGTVIAAYRVVEDGWTPAAATAEAEKVGFGFSDLAEFLTRYRAHRRPTR